MKKIFFLYVVLVFVTILQGCTRSGSSDSAKIQIQLPRESSVLVPKMTLDNSGGLADPTTLDEINCYGVFVGGPDTDLKDKVCALGNENESFDNHSGGEMAFGDWKAAIPAGQVLSMEVKSGVDRVIYLVGMKTTDGGCVDFREQGMPDKTKASSAFLLGVAGRLDLKPGAETSVNIPMSFNTGKNIVGCRGDDVLHGGDGDGDDGGGSNIPYLRFEGIGSYDSVLDVDKATVDECYPFRPGLYKGHGGAWIDSGNNDININVSSLAIGQFYSGANCTVPVTNLVIPAGQNKSLSYYYFKASSSVTGTLANVVFSGNTEVITGAQQKFDIGLRKIVIHGPNRLVLNECYPYKIFSRRYEGGFLNTPAGGATGTLSETAAFAFRTGSDCSAGTSANIAPYNNETTVHMKLLSSAGFNLANYLSMSGYAVQPFLVSNSAHEDHYHALSARLLNDNFVRGECNNFDISLINHDGGAVKARVLLNIKVKSQQGAGVFYAGLGCTGTPTENIQIVPGTTSAEVSFRAHAIPPEMLTAGKIPVYIDSGALKLNGTLAGNPSIAWVDVIDSTNSKILLKVPGFSGAQIIGDHEFTGAGSVLEIPLLGDYNGIMDVECSSTPGTGFSSCSAAEVDRSSEPYKYKWTAVNATGNTPRYVRFSYSSYSTQDVGIVPSLLYGPKFKVIACSHVAPAGSVSMSTVVGMNATVLCLPASTVINKTSTSGYALGSGRRSIIGHSSGTSVIASNSNAGTSVDLTSAAIAEDRYIANLKIDAIALGGFGIKADSVTATATAKVYIDNVSLNTASGSVAGVYFTNVASDPDLSFAIRNIKIDFSGANSYGLHLDTVSRVLIEDSELNVIGGNSHGVKIYSGSGTGGDHIELANSLVKVVYGVALGVYNSSTSTGDSNIFRNSRFIRSSPGYGSSDIVYIAGRFTGSNFDGNLVMAEPGASNTSLMNVVQSSVATSFTMVGNTFVQPTTSPLVVMNGTNNVTEFTKNSFAYTGTTVAHSAGAVNIVGSTFSPSSIVGTTGANIACGLTGYVFSGFSVISSGGVSGGVSLNSIPIFPNNVITNTGRCRGP